MVKDVMIYVMSWYIWSIFVIINKIISAALTRLTSGSQHLLPLPTCRGRPPYTRPPDRPLWQVTRASRRTTIPTVSRRSSDVHQDINWYINNLLLESKLSGLSSIISYEYWQITFCKNPLLLPNLCIIKSIQQYLSLINKMDSNWFKLIPESEYIQQPGPEGECVPYEAPGAREVQLPGQETHNWTWHPRQAHSVVLLWGVWAGWMSCWIWRHQDSN